MAGDTALAMAGLSAFVEIVDLEAVSEPCLIDGDVASDSVA